MCQWALKAEYGSESTPEQQIHFIGKQFVARSIVLINYHNRETQKAIFIQLDRPELNAQVADRAISLI